MQHRAAAKEAEPGQCFAWVWGVGWGREFSYVVNGFTRVMWFARLFRLICFLFSCSSCFFGGRFGRWGYGFVVMCSFSVSTIVQVQHMRIIYNMGTFVFVVLTC